MNKKGIIAIAASAVAVLSLVVGYTLLTSNNDEETVTKEESKQAVLNLDLPNIKSIDSNKSPILYDFVNSSLTYKWDGRVDKLGFFYAIMQNNKDKSKIYVSYYTYPEEIRYPTLGTRPKTYAVNEQNNDLIKRYVEKLGNNRKFKEGDWSLYLVSQFKDGKANKYETLDSSNRWAGINFDKFNVMDNGLMYDSINSGLGWPTEWLRKAPYNKTMKSEGINVKDKFWDDYNIGSVLNYINPNTSQELEVKVVQIDRFTYKENGMTININEKNLKTMLKVRGWEEN